MARKPEPAEPTIIAPEARDLELFVSCKSCGFEVASGLRRTPGELAGMEIEPREHRCPRCGQAHLYAGSDYAYRS